MRFFSVLAPLLLAAALGACAGGGPVSPGRRGPGLSPADRADPIGALRRAGAGDAMTPDGARDLFGPAQIERRDGAGAILTWRTQTCAIVLAFGADRAGALRLGAADIAGRDQHAPNPPPEQCVREALARRAVS
jgi:hypothetical protein